VLQTLVSTNTRGTNARCGTGTSAIVMTLALEAQLLHRGAQLLVIRPGSTLILLMCVLGVAVEDAAAGLEFGEGLHGQGGHAVVLAGGVVSFVDGDCGVHNFGLDGFFVYNWDDGFVDVVVHVLARNGTLSLVALGGLVDGAAGLELG